jgi:hypothetical protein
MEGLGGSGCGHHDATSGRRPKACGGIGLAKPPLEVAGLADEVEIEAAPGVLTIRPSAHPRAGWQKRQQQAIEKVCSMK